MGGSRNQYLFCGFSYFYLCGSYILFDSILRCSAQAPYGAVAPPAFVNAVPLLALQDFYDHQDRDRSVYKDDDTPVYLDQLPPQYLYSPYFVPFSSPQQLLRAQPSNVGGSRHDGKHPTQSLFTDAALVRTTANLECGTISTPAYTRLLEEVHVPPPPRNRFSRQEDDAGLLTSLQVDFPKKELMESEFYKALGPRINLDKKITFGQLASKNEAPWQVAMFVGGKFHCGASIIGDIFILTAAHCVTAYKNRPHALKLSLGDWDLKTRSDGNHVDAEIEEVRVHSGFSFLTLQNDIAILKLKTKITFNERIRSACLPPPGLDVNEKLLTVTGWGRNEKNILQTQLQKLTAVAIENTNCADKWTRSGAPRSIIGTGTLCIDTQVGDSCKGDSGGPAVMEYPEHSGKYIQVGIVSFGSGSCTDTSLPGVYTRVGVFLDWIAQNMT